MKITTATYRNVEVLVLDVDIDAGTALVALQDEPDVQQTVDAAKLMNAKTSVVTEADMTKEERYEHVILPAMDLNDLLSELTRAAVANQNADGRQYGEMNHQISLIRAEIVRRTK